MCFTQETKNANFARVGKRKVSSPAIAKRKHLGRKGEKRRFVVAGSQSLAGVFPREKGGIKAPAREKRPHLKGEKRKKGVILEEGEKKEKNLQKNKTSCAIGGDTYSRRKKSQTLGGHKRRVPDAQWLNRDSKKAFYNE